MFPATGSTAGRYIAAGILTALIAIGLEFVTNATPMHTPVDTSVALYSATTEEEICLENGECGVLTVDVRSTRNGAGDVLCVDIETNEGREHGCADVTHAVRVDAERGIWATLPETSLDLYTLTCDESGTCLQSSSRPVQIEATWSTESPASGLLDQERTCSWPNGSGGAVRAATLQLTIDDYSLRTFGSIRVATAGPVANCLNAASGESA